MISSSHGARFMAAFNDIEDHFRTTLNADPHVPFANMARDYADRKRLPYQQREALTAFGLLRNAISHSRYYGGRPIAEPVNEVVQQIEQLRDQIKAPPQALTVLGQMDVCIARPNEPISSVLEHVRRFDYSQLPVYDDNGYVGLLTTNAIARWLAAQLTVNSGLAEEEPVSRVLGFAERHERALLLPRTVTAAEAIDWLSHGGESGKPVTALIVTHSGKATDRPLAVVVAEDLPKLSAALTLA